MVEGEDTLIIEDNLVMGNLDGIVLVQCKGLVTGNKIYEN